MICLFKYEDFVNFINDYEQEILYLFIHTEDARIKERYDGILIGIDWIFQHFDDFVFRG